MTNCPYCGRDYEETIDSLQARAEYEDDIEHLATKIRQEQGIDPITAIEMAKKQIKRRRQDGKI